MFHGSIFLGKYLRGNADSEISGITATAGDNRISDAGVHIMVAGLVLQVFSLVLYVALCLEFAWRVRQTVKDERFVTLRGTGSFRVFKYGW